MVDEPLHVASRRRVSGAGAMLAVACGRLPGQKTIENEDKGSHCSYRPESNFGTMDTVNSDNAALERGPRALAFSLLIVNYFLR